MVSESLLRVQNTVQSACSDAGRPQGSVTLIAVSKTHPQAAIREAYAAGQRDFGESYAQELAGKAEALSDLPDIRWHYIGTIQTNKAALIAPVSYRVHAVHSVRHAAALARRSDVPVPCLIAVNLAGEDSKTGVAQDEVLTVARGMNALDGVTLCGLMTLPPADESARPYFDRLRALAAQGRDDGLPLDELSMGMSGDYVEAIAAGATWVRVGTAIFGPRPS